MIERIGLALIALVLAAMFALVAVASFIGGEPFLGVMGAIGCLMVLWVGGLTLFRGDRCGVSRRLWQTGILEPFGRLRRPIRQTPREPGSPRGRTLR